MRAVTPVLLCLALAACHVEPLDGPPDTVAPPAEAGPDATPPDAAEPDAAQDAPTDTAPPVCTEAGRFVVSATDAGVSLTGDSKSGLVWTRDVAATTVAFAPLFCERAGFRSPTKTELAGLLLKPGACVPALDTAGFANLTTVGDTYASDGCVNFTDGTTKAACTTAPVYALCVVP